MVEEGEGCHDFSVHKSCCYGRMTDIFFHYHWEEMMRQNYIYTAEMV